MRTSLYDFCREHGCEYLLEEWDQKQNGDATPENTSYGSKRKVWWRCGEGHTWEAAVYTRSGKQVGCPYCTRKRVWPGAGLDATHPELAEQWHPVKNLPLTPDQVLSGSQKYVWWVCGKGHEWKASIKSRANGHGCPVCSNRTVVPGVNDLAAIYPELAGEWHPVKNGSMLPSGVGGGSSRKVWWRCSKGHEWQASINSRVRGANCPVCSGRTVIPGENDLASYSPKLAEQWVYEKNLPLSPERVSAFSNRRVWWRCELGHEWQAAVGSRTNNGHGCPYCAGRRVLPGFNDLKTQYPELAEQWDMSLNGLLTPDQVTPGSHKKAWWRCGEGHVWTAAVYSRTSLRTGCPVCAGRLKKYKSDFYLRIETEARMRKTPGID